MIIRLTSEGLTLRGGGCDRADADPLAFQEERLRAFEASRASRRFSELTIGNGAGTLARFLAACGPRPGR